LLACLLACAINPPKKLDRILQKIAKNFHIFKPFQRLNTFFHKKFSALFVFSIWTVFSVRLKIVPVDA